MSRKTLLSSAIIMLCSFGAFADLRPGFGPQFEIFTLVNDGAYASVLDPGGYLSLYIFNNEKKPDEGFLLRFSVASPYMFHLAIPEYAVVEINPMPFGKEWRVVLEAGPALKSEENRLDGLFFSSGVYASAIFTSEAILPTLGVYAETTLVIPLDDTVGLDIGLDAQIRVLDLNPDMAGDFNYAITPRIGLSFVPVPADPRFN